MNATAAIRGFIAWCEEFVDQVLDHNESLMTVEFNEQIAILQTATEVVDLEIPDIKSDEMLVKVLDELKYRIKGGKYNAEGRSLTEAFDWELSRFIRNNGLDSDPHTLASMPKPEVRVAGDSIFVPDGMGVSRDFLEGDSSLSTSEIAMEIGKGMFNAKSAAECLPGHREREKRNSPLSSLKMRVRELVLTLDGISIGVVGGYGHSISTPTLLHLNDILLARGAYVALDNVLDHESEEFGKWEKLTFVLHEVEDGSDVRTHLIKIPPDNGAFLSDETCIIHSVVAGIIHPDMLRDPHVQCLTTEDRDGNPCDPVCAHCGAAEAYCKGTKE